MSTCLDTIPQPITPGAEMAALLRFHRAITWTGRICEGEMGPATPAMTAAGRGSHEVIQDGRWVVGTYSQEQYLHDGTFVLRWQLHWWPAGTPGCASTEYLSGSRTRSPAADLSS